MSAGTSIALATVRVPHGADRPPESVFREAIERDRKVLGVPPDLIRGDLAVAGPYVITVGERQLDEYVVWER